MDDAEDDDHGRKGAGWVGIGGRSKTVKGQIESW